MALTKLITITQSVINIYVCMEKKKGSIQLGISYVIRDSFTYIFMSKTS